MSLFKGKRYRKCQMNEDNSLDCIAYSPRSDGKKVVTASIKAQMSSDCNVNIIDQDGDPSDLEELEEHLSKRVRSKCKQPSNL